jgi:predicted TIM-barrel fold metal-dependent hydrolase
MPLQTLGTATKLIDADAHITEPWNLWTDRMSKARWGDLIPTVKWDQDDNRQGWYIGDVRLADLGFSTMFRGPADKPERLPDISDESRGLGTRAFYPKSFDEMHPSSWDPTERVRVMTEWGIDAACLYPNLLLFNSRVLEAAGNEAVEFSSDMMRAYNDFIIDFSKEAEGHIIPLACLPYWDIAASVKEAERCAEAGHRGLVMSGYPQTHGAPYLADPHWDLLWSTAESASMPIHFHAGSGDNSAHANDQRTQIEGSAVSAARGATEILFSNGVPICDLLSSGILARHPQLKFVSVESGVGWIPFALESLDSHFARYDVRTYRPEFELLPSEYFRRQIYTTVWFEELSPFYVDRVGVNNIMFETDYPHPTCLIEDEIERAIDHSLAALDDDQRERILWKNAAELYRF